MKIAKLILLYATLFVLFACGGGSESLDRDDTSTDDDTDTTEIYTISLSLVDAQGEVATEVGDGAPLTVRASVTNSSGQGIANEVVTFVLSQTELADFDNDTGTALTDSEGLATIELTVGSLSGSGTITASVEDAESVTIGFQSAGLQQENPFSLELFASSLQLASSGGDEIELIAVVKNDQNILLANVPVSFSAGQDASLTIIDTQTQADGTARATLSTQNNRENRDIEVSASTSALSENVTVQVVGTEVNINGASSVIINDSAPITVVLSDSDGNGIANQVVNLSATLGTLDNETPVTGTNGQVTVNYISSQSGNDKISASALSANTTFDITVQQDDFSFVNLPTEDLSLNTDHALELRWFKDGSAFANGDIVVTSSRGIIGAGNNSAVTNAQGIASITINSSYAGPTSISAVGTDANGNEVTARTQLEFVAETVDSIFVDASPDLIGPEGQTSTITATVRDEVGNLVKGKTVNFRLIADASSGSISPNSATTDSNGIASTVYTSNAVSGDNGVTIGAQSDGVESTVDLSVGARAFDIVVGTGNDIGDEDNTSYIKEFSVFVTDASGQPVSNASLSASVVPVSGIAYYKGYWSWDDENDIYVAQITASCQSEDVNQNGRLDSGEDTNDDGLLTPGNVATVNFKENETTTNEFGQAVVQVRYPQQYAVWSRVKLTILGQSSGTESKTSQIFGLPILAEDLTTQAISPPSNPFGSSAFCSVSD
ncbi:Ig-like domain-containing protein [Glaciecola sp. 2405UD65-10]|uniref:Ig-like domain-containing protein n=1 Tax=Glaciecola sp. 2405UD65-10 TaxID=3397244 RepID=UPI003B599510